MKHHKGTVSQGEGQAEGGVFSQHLSWEEINCDMQA